MKTEDKKQDSSVEKTQTPEADQSQAQIDNDLNKIEAGLESGADFQPGPDDVQAKSVPVRDDSGIGQMIVMVTSLLCDRMAEATGLPEMALKEAEAQHFNEAVEDVAALYDLGSNPWAGLAMMSGAIIIPRYMMLKQFKQAQPEQGASDGDQSRHKPAE